MNGFITVTRMIPPYADKGPQRFPGHRINVAHIARYAPADDGSAYLVLTGDVDIRVAESCEEIDRLVSEALAGERS